MCVRDHPPLALRRAGKAPMATSFASVACSPPDALRRLDCTFQARSTSVCSAILRTRLLHASVLPTPVFGGKGALA